MAQLQLAGTNITASSSLEQALQLVESRLTEWASNAPSFNALLLEIFGEQNAESSGALQSRLSGSGLGILLEILDGTTLLGIRGAYTSADPTGQERIYLNADWLQSATAAEIEAVLLEEVGHAIDHTLNGERDTAGDEGEIFSARLRGLTPASSAFSEDDHRLISLNGVPVGVEAFVPAAPDPTDASPVTNPFGIISVDFGNVGNNAKPTFVDADGDGDLDLFIGERYGNTVFFRNTAAPGSSVPAYTAPTVNPFGITDIGDNAAPAFADIDRDGDLDLFIGNASGNIVFFRNTAAAWATAPAYAGPSTNPFGIIGGYNYSGALTPTAVGYLASPTFADIDRDGDLDLLVGNELGQIALFRNTAAAGSVTPAFSAENLAYGFYAGLTGTRFTFGFSPIFGITDVGDFAAPAFADIDGDGDLDLFIGNYKGDTLFFRNTAASGATAPAYAAAITNPFGITDAGYSVAPTFADIDGDGDLDLFIGDNYGNTIFFQNTATSLIAAVRSTSNGGRYGVGSVITLTVTFSQVVLVDTTHGVPQLRLETGAIDRAAVYSSGSGTDTLVFQYAVQAGDSSADLDQASASAISLYGGTIKDQSGNDVDLTLAAPGAFGSLAANSQLVIETIAPTGSLGSYATAPAYAAAITNPFGITDTGYSVAPTFADSDGDGDLDLFTSDAEGNTIFFQNTAAAGARAPSYAGPSTNPFGIISVGGFGNKPALTDVDGDGDLDLFIGTSDGNTTFFRNTAAPGSSVPAYTAPTVNPFGITDVGDNAAPAFADIDRDGDLDLFVGNGLGNIFFFRNTASVLATAPAYASPSANPFGIASGFNNDFGPTAVGLYAGPVLVDADRDGDLDLFIGNDLGQTAFFRNTAAPGSTTPAYNAENLTFGDFTGLVDSRFWGFSPIFGITDVGSFAAPSFADIDGDGDLDLYIGNYDGNTLFFLNTAATPVAPVNSSTANGTYGIGSVITLTVQFSEAVLVTGTPQLQLETGIIDRYATYSSGSGTDTLSFQYTVQAGDTSADLDQLSANALSLNGGTIKDVAGNNAILTLAVPGATGSLGANAALVIDGLVPTLQSSSPADGATNVAVGGNLVLTFSETVVAGSGLISLYLANGTLVESFDVATGVGSAGGSVDFSGSGVTLNPFADLVRGSGYSLQVASTAVVDGAGNAYAGISDATSLNFNTAPVTVSVGSITVSESSLYAVVAVGIDAPLSDDLSFIPALLNGSATCGSDTGSSIWAFVGGSWVSAASGVTLTAGSTSVLLRVAISNDTTLEGLETFQFSTGAISAAAGALTNAAGVTGTVTIADDGSSAQIFDQDTSSATPLIRSVDNDTPSITVSSVIISEASDQAVLQVSLSNPSTFPISFTPFLQSGSATIGTDTGSTLEVFNGSSWETAGVVSFAAGVTSRLLRVAINNDSDFESSEFFTINTGAISGSVANPTGASGTVTIRDNGTSTNTFLAANNTATPTAGTADNDTPPLPALSAAVLTNGNETGPVAAVFRISRSGTTTAALVVSYRLAGTAIAGSDYTTPSGFDASTGVGTVTIAAGQSSVDLSVPSLDDNAVDGNRSLSLTLQTSLTYSIAAATATASIFDNDVAAPVTPTLSISSASVVETDTGSNPIINLTVSLSAAAATSVSVRVRTLAAASGNSATGTTVTGGGDYVAISDQLLTFVPGATSQQLAIQLLGDNTIESTESFRVELFNATGATLPASAATIEIVDNDSSKSITTDNSSATTAQIFSGGQYADVLIGGSAGDTINGDPAGLIGGGDAITGNGGADILTGGPGADRFRYLAFSDSTLNNSDRIRDLTLTGSDQDRIALAALPSALWNTGVLTPASATLASAVATAFADKNVLTAGNQALAAGEAVLFAYDSTPGNSRTRQWFVAVNDSNAAFSSSNDLLINVTGLTSSFATGSLTASLLFTTL